MIAKVEKRRLSVRSIRDREDQKAEVVCTIVRDREGQEADILSAPF